MDEILEHEILKVLFVRNGSHSGDTQKVGQKVVPIHKRDFSDYSLHFGTLVDILNNPDKYSQKGNALRGHIEFEEEINADKYSYGVVSNAIEILFLNGQVTDYVDPHKPRRIITLKPKGAVDYFDNFYPKKKQNEGLDIKIKKLTISNTKITRIIAIAALIVSITIGTINVIKFLDERSTSRATPTKSQIDSLLQSNLQLTKNLQEYQQTLFRGDTSVKKEKVEK